MKTRNELEVTVDSPGALSPIAALADIPEEEIWLAKQESKRTRRAYKQDVRHFMQTLCIRSYDELRQVDHRAVIAWERIMRETDGAAPRRCAADLRPFPVSSSIWCVTTMLKRIPSRR